MNRRGFFKCFAAAIAGTAVASAIPIREQLRVFNIGERDGWRLKIALEPGRVIVAHDGPTSNGHSYPAEAWAQAVTRGAIPIRLEGEALPVGWATDFRVDVTRWGYVVSCFPVLIPGCQNQIARLRRAGSPVFLTPTGAGQILGGLVQRYVLRQFDLNHVSAFRHASPLAPPEVAEVPLLPVTPNGDISVTWPESSKIFEL